MNWISNSIALLALGVSACSLYVSWTQARRAKNAEKITGWIDLEGTASRELFVATLNIKNPSSYDIKLEKLAIDLPDYRLADFDKACIDDGGGGRVLPSEISSPELCLVMPSPKKLIASGEDDHIKFLIFQPSHSARKSTEIAVMYWTMEPKPKLRQLRLKVKTRPDF